MAEGISATDAIALQDRNGMFGGDSGFFWVFALLLLNNGGWTGNGGRAVTDTDLAISQNAQTQQLQMQALQQQLSDNRFDVAQVINQQTSELVAQNNTNLINAIQGFNNLGLQITNQTNVLSQQMMALDAKMTQCCCDIKTQMLQDRLTDAQAMIVAQRGEISNAQQTQTILNTLGRFVAWAGSGSQTLSSGT